MLVPISRLTSGTWEFLLLRIVASIRFCQVLFLLFKFCSFHEYETVSHMVLMCRSLICNLLTHSLWLCFIGVALTVFLIIFSVSLSFDYGAIGVSSEH